MLIILAMSTLPPRKRYPRDMRLQQKLVHEDPGILAWIVRGAVDWYTTNLPPCEAIKNATEALRLSTDVVGRFLSECCIRGPDVTDATLFSVMHLEYTDWCKENAETALKKKLFKGELKSKGVSDPTQGTRDPHKNKLIIAGIRLKFSECSEEGCDQRQRTEEMLTENRKRYCTSCRAVCPNFEECRSYRKKKSDAVEFWTHCYRCSRVQVDPPLQQGSY